MQGLRKRGTYSLNNTPRKIMMIVYAIIITASVALIPGCSDKKQMSPEEKRQAYRASKQRHSTAGIIFRTAIDAAPYVVGY